jgi:UDP:flavonoid glycosyltransferase YjiC (YdhE family)
MRVLMTSLPAMGHFNSIQPMAHALAAAGHQVAICCAPAFAETVRANGFEHLPGGAESFAELFVGAPPPAERANWALKFAFATNGAQRMLPDLTRHVAEWQPDVLVRESTEFAALLVGEQLGLPHASIGTGALGSRDDRREIVADVLTTWRDKLNLPADPEAQAMYRYLHLSFMPPRWDGEESGVVYADTVHFIRYQNPPRPGEARPEWLDEPRDRPLVLVSLGTVMNAEPGLFEAIISALADEPMEVVVAIGRDQDATRFGRPPANVRIESFVPQIQVLEQCALFVTHCGFNSTKEALSLGIPLVAIPIGGDQPYCAERIEALGLGRRVGPEERDPATIRAAVREVSDDPHYRAAVQGFAEEMRSLPPISDAVGLLEQLATNRRAIRLER